MQDVFANVIVFEIVHHVHPIALTLLVKCNGTKCDLGKPLRGECPEANPPDRAVVFHKCQSVVLPKTKTLSENEHQLFLGCFTD